MDVVILVDYSIKLFGCFFSIKSITGTLILRNRNVKPIIVVCPIKKLGNLLVKYLITYGN